MSYVPSGPELFHHGEGDRRGHRRRRDDVVHLEDDAVFSGRPRRLYRYRIGLDVGVGGLLYRTSPEEPIARLLHLLEAVGDLYLRLPGGRVVRRVVNLIVEPDVLAGLEARSGEGRILNGPRTNLAAASEGPAKRSTFRASITLLRPSTVAW